MKRIALYPGTFDPVTNGHLDIMKRSCSICDNLIVAVAENQDKSPLFSINERIKLLEDAINFSSTLTKSSTKIKVHKFNNLLKG